MKMLSLFMVLIMLAGCLSSCNQTVTKAVVVYTSVDQVFSEPVFQQFEKQTGIHVLPVYDVEAAKTTGLVNRLITEKGHPRADVFWSGEFAQTILLKDQDVLAPYKSPNSIDIPPGYIDPEGYWTAFSGRARTLLVNTSLVSPDKYPKSILDLVNGAWPADKIGIAYPVFGSTSTEAAALYAVLGPEKARAFYQKLHDRGVRVVDGIAVVRSLVVGGQLMMGLVDTDDAVGAIDQGGPVTMLFLDQADMGTLIIPNTVAVIAGGPNPDEAKTLIDFLLSREVTESLVKSGWSHVPIRPSDPQSDRIEITKVRSMKVNLTDVYNQLKLSQKELAEIYIR
jgi:iron(III) transport system substrate-binding protein